MDATITNLNQTTTSPILLTKIAGVMMIATTPIAPVLRKLAGRTRVNPIQRNLIGADLPGESTDSAEPSPMNLCNAM